LKNAVQLQIATLCSPIGRRVAKCKCCDSVSSGMQPLFLSVCTLMTYTVYTSISCKNCGSGNLTQLRILRLNFWRLASRRVSRLKYLINAHLRDDTSQTRARPKSRYVSKFDTKTRLRILISVAQLEKEKFSDESSSRDRVIRHVLLVCWRRHQCKRFDVRYRLFVFEALLGCK
jgi:hypothetical protein